MPDENASGELDLGLPPEPPCPFCARISAGQYDNRTAPHEAGPHGDVVTFEPLSPVTPGHRLVVPVAHVTDALENPTITKWTMEFAAEVARNYGIRSCNLITSVGTPATQTIRHLHIHIVPRRDGDGLHLPWTGQQPAGERPDGEYARVEIMGHDAHTGWVTDGNRAGAAVMVIRDWDNRVIAEVPGQSLYRFIPLPTPLKRPELPRAITAGVWDDDDDVWDDDDDDQAPF